MLILRPSLVLGSLVISYGIILLSTEVTQVDSVYAYAIKGIVKDVRLHPTRFIGGWFFKKAFILKKLKIKLKLKKKLILKKLLKKLLLGVALAKSKGGIKIFAPKIILPAPPSYFAHGWGRQHYWSHAPLHLFRRKKRAVRFPEDDDNTKRGQIGSSSSSSYQNPQQNQNQYPHFRSNEEYFQRYNIGSLGLSQSDMDELRRLPDNLKYEYGQEMEQLEASASEPKEEEIQDYLSMASEFDNNGCIPKSICEIMSRGNRTTNPFENQILEYYNDSTGLEKRTGTPSYVYDYAAYIGRTTRDARACISQFSNCPDEPIALNSFMNEVFTPEMCDPSSLFPDINNNNHHHHNQYSH